MHDIETLVLIDGLRTLGGLADDNAVGVDDDQILRVGQHDDIVGQGRNLDDGNAGGILDALVGDDAACGDCLIQDVTLPLLTAVGGQSASGESRC